LRTNKTVCQRRWKTAMNGLMGTFSLPMFDGFFAAYKATNTLAPEALMALDHFLPALNEFFDLCDDVNQDMVMNDTKIHWYSYTNMVASGDYIRAKSKYYGQPEFSNVSIKMDEEEIDDYNTDEGSCFGKVCTISLEL
jgi:hypothetical protein